jgi:2,3-bisphosphoglycerate-dependent phosphoglycerate mutase
MRAATIIPSSNLQRRIAYSYATSRNSSLISIPSTCNCFLRYFTSSLPTHDGSNKKGKALSSSPSPFATVHEAPGRPKKPKQPQVKVPINKTPRGQAAARLKIVQEEDDHDHETTINPSANTNIHIALGTTGASNTNNNNSHDHTHFVRGGVPCDPAAPPFRLADYGDESLYTLVLLRHGESEWNCQNRYTGWCDVNLTDKGRIEARDAGRLLKESEIELDHVFTSVLRRANFTTNMALNTSEQHFVPVTKSWRLNERHYGALQGYNKDTAYEELGIDQELVMEMRRSYNTRPPTMEDDHPFWHGNDRRYKYLSSDQLERSRAESLKDTANRILPFYRSQIIPSLRAGNKCLIVSHANTIRTLIKHIDNISDEDIKGMSIPTGIPLLYRLDKNMRPVDPKMELEFRFMIEPKGFTWATSRQHGFHGVYLGDLERLQEIQKKRDATNRDWQRIILRNIARQLVESHADDADDADDVDNKDGDSDTDVDVNVDADADVGSDGVMEIRQLYFHIHSKMKVKELGNMVLLVRMKNHLEELMLGRKQQYLTMEGFETILTKLHLDAEGHVVEPFVDMNDESGRVQRAKEYDEMLALDLEEECLIK